MFLLPGMATPSGWNFDLFTAFVNYVELYLVRRRIAGPEIRVAMLCFDTVMNDFALHPFEWVCYEAGDMFVRMIS